MKQITTFTAALVLSALPAMAQDTNEALEDGAEMLREGFGLLLQGLSEELTPLAEGWAEGWADFVEELGDMSLYHAPETLPNGDIIIRRKVPLVPEEKAPGEVEL